MNYIIELICIYVPYSVANRRVSLRQMKIGRIVPMRLVKLCYKRIPINFFILKEHANFYSLWYNYRSTSELICNQEGICNDNIFYKWLKNLNKKKFGGIKIYKVPNVMFLFQTVHLNL